VAGPGGTGREAEDGSRLITPILLPGGGGTRPKRTAKPEHSVGVIYTKRRTENRAIAA
jgi:hypothetical protein